MVAIHYGYFFTHNVRMRLAEPKTNGPRTAKVVKTEAKGSNVNLASHLLLDASQRDCDVAVVISNDSDLRVPIRIAEQQLGVTVGIVNPQPAKSRSRVLRGTFFKQLRPSILEHCQLPEVMSDQYGQINKPTRWRSETRRDPPKRAPHPATEATRVVTEHYQPGSGRSQIPRRSG